MESHIIVPDFGRIVERYQGPEKPKEMLSVLRDGTQTYVKINSSSLSLLQTCARKSYYKLVAGWEPRAGSPPLVYGSAIHKAMEVFYSYAGAERALPVGFDEIAPMLADQEPPEQHFLYDAIRAFVKVAYPLRLLPDTDARSIASGIWVLTHYFKTYLHDEYVIASDERGPLVERTFTVPFHEDERLKIDLFGTIDFVLKNTRTGEILTGDHKTTSRMGNDFLNKIKPNHQYTGYLYGAHKTFGVSGEHFLVNGIQSKARPLTARGGPPTFTRQITRRTPEDFQEFRESLLDAVGNFLRWQDTNAWPLGPVDACASYGGCQYHDVCSQPNMLRETILENKFSRPM